MYELGNGVPENNVRAYVWLSMAKTQGDEDGKKAVEIVKNKMTRQQIAQAQALATQCYESDYKDCDWYGEEHWQKDICWIFISFICGYSVDILEPS